MAVGSSVSSRLSSNSSLSGEVLEVLLVDDDVLVVGVALEISLIVLVIGSLQHSIKAGSHGMPKLNFFPVQLLPLDPVKIPF